MDVGLKYIIEPIEPNQLRFWDLHYKVSTKHTSHLNLILQYAREIPWSVESCFVILTLLVPRIASYYKVTLHEPTMGTTQKMTVTAYHSHVISLKRIRTDSMSLTVFQLVTLPMNLEFSTDSSYTPKLSLAFWILTCQGWYDTVCQPQCYWLEQKLGYSS